MRFPGTAGPAGFQRGPWGSGPPAWVCAAGPAALTEVQQPHGAVCGSLTTAVRSQALPLLGLSFLTAA